MALTGCWLSKAEVKKAALPLRDPVHPDGRGGPNQ